VIDYKAYFVLVPLSPENDDLAGNFILHVPENGLIVINVPLDPLRLGAFSTRTTHPFLHCEME
jgi:hypothetical protein